MNDKKKHHPTHMVPPVIRKTVGFVDRISPRLSSRVALQLFLTPIRFKTPQRELKFLEDCTTKDHSFSHRKIKLYHWGDEAPAVLLVHGWCGRATQLGRIAQQLQQMGVSVLAFDAPAHGKSTGKQTNLLEFSLLIQDLCSKYPSIKNIIGHSMGGVAMVHSLNNIPQIEKVVMISSPSSTPDIIDEFSRQINIAPETGKRMIQKLEKKFQRSIDTTSAEIIVSNLSQQGLIIHDQDDPDVPVSCAYVISKKWSQSQLFITENLGHRKLLYEASVLDRIKTFLYS